MWFFFLISIVCLECECCCYAYLKTYYSCLSCFVSLPQLSLSFDAYITPICIYNAFHCTFPASLIRGWTGGTFLIFTNPFSFALSPLSNLLLPCPLSHTYDFDKATFLHIYSQEMNNCESLLLVLVKIECDFTVLLSLCFIFYSTKESLTLNTKTGCINTTQSNWKIHVHR